MRRAHGSHPPAMAPIETLPRRSTPTIRYKLIVVLRNARVAALGGSGPAPELSNSAPAGDAHERGGRSRGYAAAHARGPGLGVVGHDSQVCGNGDTMGLSRLHCWTTKRMQCSTPMRTRKSSSAAMICRPAVGLAPAVALHPLPTRAIPAIASSVRLDDRALSCRRARMVPRAALPR